MTIEQESRNAHDISFRTDKGRFNYRVAGVILHEERVLLLTEDRFDFWYLPGGRATLLETSDQALKREIFEELGETPVVDRLLWTTECLYHFDAWNIKHHDLAFYYLIHFPKEAPIYTLESGTGKEQFSNTETILHFKWFEINKLKGINLVPHFLIDSLNKLPTYTQHIIINELPE